MHEALTEVAIGEQAECLLCGETLVRRVPPRGLEMQDDPYFVEVASGEEHQCWTQLPDDAEHLRLDS